MVHFHRTLNVIFIFVLSAVLLAAFFYQFIVGEEPCFLCFLQRLQMIAIAAALLMNLRFGIKVQHYGLAILSALLGRIVALRHISFHFCSTGKPEMPPVLGYELYAWAFIVFTCSLVACGLLLILMGYSKRQDYHPTWGFWEKASACLVGAIALGNVVNALIDCGIYSCA
jgi:disulfide bond formation protein DsbB